MEKFIEDMFGNRCYNIDGVCEWVAAAEERITKLEEKSMGYDTEPYFETGPIKMLGCNLFPPDMEFVEKKKYDELEAKHEADCRLISEYDLEIKRLEDKCSYLEKENRTFNVLLINKTETIGKIGYEYDKLEEKYNKLLKDYKLLTESNNNHAKDNVELEGELEAKTNRIAALEEKLRNQRTNLASLQEKYEDACKMNKAREDVYESNLKLKSRLKTKDREIDLLRAELDKYKTDDECDDSWID